MLYPCAFRCHLGSVYSRYHHILLQKSIVVGGCLTWVLHRLGQHGTRSRECGLDPDISLLWSPLTYFFSNTENFITITTKGISIFCSPTPSYPASYYFVSKAAFWKCSSPHHLRRLFCCNCWMSTETHCCITLSCLVHSNSLTMHVTWSVMVIIKGL